MRLRLRLAKPFNSINLTTRFQGYVDGEDLTKLNIFPLHRGWHYNKGVKSSVLGQPVPVGLFCCNISQADVEAEYFISNLISTTLYIATKDKVCGEKRT